MNVVAYWCQSSVVIIFNKNHAITSSAGYCRAEFDSHLSAYFYNEVLTSPSFLKGMQFNSETSFGYPK
jgi:hypothetical protein